MVDEFACRTWTKAPHPFQLCRAAPHFEAVCLSPIVPTKPVVQGIVHWRISATLGRQVRLDQDGVAVELGSVPGLGGKVKHAPRVEAVLPLCSLNGA
jgi:hypothetical protein